MTNENVIAAALLLRSFTIRSADWPTRRAPKFTLRSSGLHTSTYMAKTSILCEEKIEENYDIPGRFSFASLRVVQVKLTRAPNKLVSKLSIKAKICRESCEM